MILSGIADEAGKLIDQQIEAHRKLGWNHVELRNIGSTNVTRLDESAFDEVMDKLDASGMKVTCFASEIANWSRNIGGDFRIDVNDLRCAIPRMKKLKTKYIRIMSYPNDGRKEALWRKEVFKRLKELTKIAEGEGIILAHENCSGWGGVSPENCLGLVEEISSDSFRVLFDTGNPPVERQDSWDFYNKVKPYIVYMHIKDAKKEGDSKIFTLPGEGEGYVREIISDLKAIGYDGALSIEPHISAVIHEGKEADSEDAFRTYIDYGKALEKILNQA